MIIAILLAAATPAHPRRAEPSPTVSTNLALAFAVGTTADAPSSPFAPAREQSDLTGKTFFAQIPFRTDANDQPPSEGPVGFVYSGGTLRLTFKIEGAYASVGSDTYPSVAVYDQSRHGQPYVGQNAYGASTQVTVLHSDVKYLAFVQGLGASATETKFEVDMPLPPQQARTALLDSYVQVEGSLAQLHSGKIVECGTAYVAPTRDDPIEFFQSKCLAGAKISRIAIIRRSTGQILRAWTQ